MFLLAILGPALVLALVAGELSWDRRWYSPPASALVGGSFALGFLAALYVLTRSVSGVELPLTTMWFGFVVALFLGQFTLSIGTTLTDELRHFVGLCELTRDDLAELQRRAARHAFAPQAWRDELLHRIESWATA